DASHGLPIQHAPRVNALLLAHLREAEARATANGGGGVRPAATPSATAPSSAAASTPSQP
ncbi:MAG TPA: hypothetical protein VFJ16_17460, partial [Longimicrobium sp.]|nr:hypothetical protein [Longimicrobium sp.]